MELHGQPRKSALERRIRGESAANVAAEDGTGAEITIDMADLLCGELTTTTYLEDLMDTGLQHLLAVKVRWNH